MVCSLAPDRMIGSSILAGALLIRVLIMISTYTNTASVTAIYERYISPCNYTTRCWSSNISRRVCVPRMPSHRPIEWFNSLYETQMCAVCA